MGETVRFRDVEVEVDDAEEGIFVGCRGGTRFVAYEELVELADSDHEVTIR